MSSATNHYPQTGSVIQPLTLPKDWLAGLKENWQNDIVTGFILFLIALPLSLGIAIASGVPPMAGIIAAVIGGLLVSLISGSYVVVNGPAAGLIVVIMAAVERLGGGSIGYHATLAAIVMAGIMMIGLGRLKAGDLGYFFPTSVVHGMLAAIGLIIMIKELPIMLGVKPPAKEPLMLVCKIPEIIANLNPELAIIGLVSLTLLISHNLIKSNTIKKIPTPIVVVLVGIAIGMYFHIDHKEVYTFAGHVFQIDPRLCLVQLPLNVSEGLTQPNWSQIGTVAFWTSAVSILLIQGIESLLSAAAVADRLDPYRRPCNLNKDLTAIGLGTTISGMLGGVPMIAEIVRSTANVMNGARTRWSNFFHGLFLLVFVLTAANLIDKIPMSALAALLVVTGYKLTSPKVFRETHAIGGDQTILFSVTIIATLATDLLIGVSIGILAKFMLHLYHGAPASSFFVAPMELKSQADGSINICIRDAAIFSNYISIKKRLDQLPSGLTVIVNLSQTKFIDHTVMDRLHQYCSEYARSGGSLTLMGLDYHLPHSKHPLSARRLPKNGNC